MPTCTQITDALNVLASATINPNVLDDLTGLTAVLTGIGTSPSVVQLTAGGDAVLAAVTPSLLDNKTVQIIGAGRISGLTSPLNNAGTIGITLRNGGVDTIFAQNSINFGGAPLSHRPFQFSVTFVYDSVLQTLVTQSSVIVNGGSNGGVTENTSVLLDSDVEFVISSLFDVPSPSNTVTLTQFKMQLV